MTRVSIVRWNLKEVGWQISGLTDRNHIWGMVYRVRLLNKLKPNNYPKVYCVNVADRWSERLRTLTGEVYMVRFAEWWTSLLSNPYREVWIEHIEVSSSRSTAEVYENIWRKGLDGCDKTDITFLILEDSSCSKEVTYMRVGWKLRVKDKNA